MANRKMEPPTDVPSRTEHFDPEEVGAIEAPDTGGGSYGEYGWAGDFGGTPPTGPRAREIGSPDDPDALLRTAVVDALAESGCECAQLYVAASDGVVRLSGRVPTPRMKRNVIRVARKVVGVRSVRSSIARAARPT